MQKKMVDKLVHECTETTEEVKLLKITLALTIFIGITTYFVYCNWSLIKNNVSCIKFGTHKETKIW